MRNILLLLVLIFGTSICGNTETKEKETDLMEENLEYLIDQESTPSEVKKELEYMLAAKDNIKDQLDLKVWKLLSENYFLQEGFPFESALSSNLNLEEKSWRHPASFLEKRDLAELKKMRIELHKKEDKELKDIIVEEKARMVQSPADYEEVRRLYRILIERKKPNEFD
jgi:hypothetical protein